MRVTVQVKPNSKKEGVDRANDNEYVVRVNAPPTEGKANERVIELLSAEFNIPKSRVQLIRGLKSKKKIFQIG